MKKPASLRQAVTDALPALATDPDKLLVFVDKGQIISTGSAGKAFLYRYTLNLILTDWGGDPDQILFAVLEWIRRHQPDLINNTDKERHGLRFEVDVVNHNTYDLSVELQLSEAVLVTKDAEGKPAFDHLPEPEPEWERVGSLV